MKKENMSNSDSKYKIGDIIKSECSTGVIKSIFYDEVHREWCYTFELSNPPSESYRFITCRESDVSPISHYMNYAKFGGGDPDVMMVADAIHETRCEGIQCEIPWSNPKWRNNLHFCKYYDQASDVVKLFNRLGVTDVSKIVEILWALS